MYKFELSVYFFIWILANMFSLYKLFEAQTSGTLQCLRLKNKSANKKLRKPLPLFIVNDGQANKHTTTENNILANDSDLFFSIEDLKPGWRMLSRLKDVSDIEWSSWKYFIQSFWYCLMIQFLVSELLRRTNISLLKYWYIFSSLFFINLHMGYKQLIVIVAQPLIFYTIILSGGKKLSIWLTGILLLISYNSLKYKYFFWYFLDREDLHDEEVYLMLFTVAWIELRCISFCIDYVDKKEKWNIELEQTSPSAYGTLISMLSYILYLPLLYLGPMILYEDFEKSFHVTNEKLSLRLKRFLWDMLVFVIYSFMLDLAFHYIYFFAMQSNMEAIRNLPAIALCGGGLWMGLEFHVKYVISYGTAGAFARLDNMDPPPTPRCIARVHVYSQMWRYFDVGLYKFLVKYIYKPSYSTLSKYFVLSVTTYKLIASFATFVFIFMWHGTARNIFIWSVLNYVGITLEHTGKVISESSKYKWFREHVLQTEAMETRFTALLCTPLLALSAVSNFYLFAGANVGDLFFECFTHPTFWNSVVVSLGLYSCCQVSMALKDVSSRTDRMKLDVKVVQ